MLILYRFFMIFLSDLFYLFWFSDLWLAERTNKTSERFLANLGWLVHFNNRSRVITVKHHWNVSKPHLLREIFDFPRKNILPLATSMEQFHGSPTWTAHVCYVDMPGPATCRLTATRLGCWVRFFVVQEMAGWKKTPIRLFFLKLFAMEFTFPWHDILDCSIL